MWLSVVTLRNVVDIPSDVCTIAGSDVGSMSTGRKDLKADCGDLLRENPEMKQVHSLASAAAILKRVASSSAA